MRNQLHIYYFGDVKATHDFALKRTPSGNVYWQRIGDSDNTPFIRLKLEDNAVAFCPVIYEGSDGTLWRYWRNGSFNAVYLKVNPISPENFLEPKTEVLKVSMQGADNEPLESAERVAALWNKINPNCPRARLYDNGVIFPYLNAAPLEAPEFKLFMAKIAVEQRRVIWDGLVLGNLGAITKENGEREPVVLDHSRAIEYSHPNPLERSFASANEFSKEIFPYFDYLPRYQNPRDLFARYNLGEQSKFTQALMVMLAYGLTVSDFRVLCTSEAEPVINALADIFKSQSLKTIFPAEVSAFFRRHAPVGCDVTARIREHQVSLMLCNIYAAETAKLSPAEIQFLRLHPSLENYVTVYASLGRFSSKHRETLLRDLGLERWPIDKLRELRLCLERFLVARSGVFNCQDFFELWENASKNDQSNLSRQFEILLNVKRQPPSRGTPRFFDAVSSVRRVSDAPPVVARRPTIPVETRPAVVMPTEEEMQFPPPVLTSPTLPAFGPGFSL